jgi:hypothetical protein
VLKEFWNDLRRDYRYIVWAAVFLLVGSFVLDVKRWYAFVADNYGIALGMVFVTLLAVVFSLVASRFGKLPESQKYFSERQDD